MKRLLNVPLLAMALSATLVAGASPSFAQSSDYQFEFGGEIGVEGRWFPEDPLYTDQLDGVQGSLFAEPELRWNDEARTNQILFSPFLRIDARDSERSHFDLREGYWRHVEDDWDLLFGVSQVFWGVAESRHLVNVVNQIDAVEDVDEEDFLGQPMLQIGRQTDAGRFDLFLMTGFRERTFSGPDGRLRAPIPVDTDAARYESDLEEWRPDLALRYSHYVGDIDVGVHLFQGTGREPDLVPAADGLSLIPEYSVINQAGIDLQYTTDAWLWKLESIVREGQGDTFVAAVAGFEYTIFQVRESDADLGLIMEGLYDGRDDDSFPTLFNQDVFTGARLAFNDVQSTEFLAGLVTDVDDGPTSLRLEAQRRLGDGWKIEFEAQAFFEDDPTSTAAAFQNDSFITARLSLFF